MGSWHPEEPAVASLHLLCSRVNTRAADTSVFSGLPNTVGDLAEGVPDRRLARMLRTAHEHIGDAVAAYPDYISVAASVQDALTSVRNARAQLAVVAERGRIGDAERYDLDFRLARKTEQLAAASQQAALLVTRLEVPEPEDDELPEYPYVLTPGGST